MGIKGFINIRPFLSFGGGLEQIVKLLSILCWAIGGLVYIYGFIEILSWVQIYPFPSQLSSALIFLEIALHILASVLPIALIICHWKYRNIFVLIGYIIAAVIGIVFAIISLVCVASYLDKNYLKDEYIKSVKEQLKGGEFPSHMEYTVENHECCSWYGAQDFQNLYEVKMDKVNGEVGKGISKCYSGIFTVDKDGKFSDAPKPPKKKIGECQHLFRETMVRLGNYIAGMASVTIGLIFILTTLFIITFFTFPKKGVVAPNRPVTNDVVVMTPSQMAAAPPAAGGAGPGPAPGDNKAEDNLDELLKSY